MTGADTSGWVRLTAAILEAGATIVLAAMALFQSRMMKKNSDHEHARWREINEPKVVFDFPHRVLDRNAGLVLTCANLGAVNFLVVGLHVTPSTGEPTKIRFNPDEYLLVSIGEKKQMDLARVEDIRRLQSCDDKFFASIRLILQGPSGEIETDGIRCKFSYSTDAKYIKRDGGAL